MVKTQTANSTSLRNTLKTRQRSGCYHTGTVKQQFMYKELEQKHIAEAENAGGQLECKATAIKTAGSRQEKANRSTENKQPKQSRLTLTTIAN